MVSGRSESRKDRSPVISGPSSQCHHSFFEILGLFSTARLIQGLSLPDIGSVSLSIYPWPPLTRHNSTGVKIKVTFIAIPV